MQNQRNCYENVWILSGTSDGPPLVDSLLQLKYVVFASVVTHRAGKSYTKHPKLHIITGKLSNKFEIIDFLKKNQIKFVVDATHPFALIISENLNMACKEIDIPLLVLNRKSSFEKSNKFHYISNVKDINRKNLENKNILLAIGSRLLTDTASYYLNCGANVYARVLPTNESISKAFASGIKKSNIAILEPSKIREDVLEKKLCEFWNIDYVICRESGGYSQKNWERIISKSNMKLYLVKRPKLKNEYSVIFDQHNNLIEHIRREY